MVARPEVVKDDWDDSDESEAEDSKKLWENACVLLQSYRFRISDICTEI